VLSTSIDGVVRLWNVRSGQTLLQITSDSVPWCCALYNDYAVLGNSDGTLHIVQTGPGTVTTVQSHTQGVAGIAFNNIGLLLIWYIDGLIEVAEISESPEAIATTNITTATSNITMTTLSMSHLYPVVMSCYSVTDNALYSNAGSNLVKMHALRTLTQHHTYPCPSAVSAVCVADSTLYSGDVSGTVSVWNTDTHQLQGELCAQGGGITHLTHNTEHLIALCTDSSVVIWDRDSLTIINTLQVSALEIAVIELDYLLILQKSEVLLWALEDGCYHDQIELGPYFAGSSSAPTLHSSADTVVVISDRKMLPVRTIRAM